MIIDFEDLKKNKPSEKIRVWVDATRTAPHGYLHAKSTHEAMDIIMMNEHEGKEVEVLDLDYSAGEYTTDGGDYINILNWMEYNKLSYPIRIHTTDTVGRRSMLSVIEKNGWPLTEDIIEPSEA